MTREEAIKEIKMWGIEAPRQKEVLEALIPELRESEDEDERTRKAIIGLIEELQRSDKYFAGVELTDMLAYLEKQKENPKSADSIPPDCTSDAKCEDRWHKVSDSLPDNPREVLCKDEAGNYFIGRYYTGEGWEISNYDDEDKPHHLNPPVSKWIDFPSEKQKEQKPVSISCGHENDAEWSEEDEDMLNSCISSIEEAKENRYAYRETDGDTSYDHEISWLKSLRPQPKQEWSEEDETRRNCCMIYLANARDCIEFNQNIGDNARERGTKAIQEVINWLKFLPKRFNLQPKQEWTEEDKEMFNTLVSYVEDPSCWNLKCPREKLVAFIESLPKRFRPQPKQEWSEEETKDLVHILKVLDDCYAYGKHDLSKTDHDNLTSMIKSLRPSWKPSEEQIKYLLMLADYFESEGGTSNAKTLREFSEDLRKLI